MRYDVSELGRLHANCQDRAQSSAAIGKALEDLVQFVFEGIPSVTLYERNVQDEDGSQEVDLLFSHLCHVSGIPIVDIAVMVECKNETARTSSAQVREFGRKLKSRSLSIGVLVTSSGLAGNPGRNAYAAVRDELDSGQSIIVVRLDEIATAESPDLVAKLLHDRLMELRAFRGYRYRF